VSCVAPCRTRYKRVIAIGSLPWCLVLGPRASRSTILLRCPTSPQCESGCRQSAAARS
jgi:hypothetical protein